MKRLISLVLIVSCIFTFSNCSENEVDQIKPYFHFTEDTNTSPEFDANGGTSSVSFETSHNWTASSNQSWITLSCKSGTPSNANFTITVSENKSTSFREGEIEIISNNESYTIFVSQVGKEEEKEVIFTLSPSSSTVSAEGGNISLTLKYDVDEDYIQYGVFDKNNNPIDWIELTETRTNTLELIFSVSKNTSSSERVGVIVLYDSKNDKEQQAIITQEGAKEEKEIIFTLSPSSSTVSAEGGNVSLTLKYDVDINYIQYGIYDKNNNPIDWIELTATRTNTLELIFSVSENISSNERVGVIVLYDTKNDKEQQAIITQEGAKEENSVIYYTSIDGNVVQPYSESAFNVSIASNTYINGLGTITFNGKLTSIGHETFKQCLSLTSITIPDGVTSIGTWAFNGCSSLISITIPNSVTTIEYGALESCKSLTSIIIPDSVTSIGGRAFYSCNSLTSVTIPDSVTSIGEWTFYNCDSLTSITIPDSVTMIGIYAFNSCNSLKSITIPDSVTKIGDHAFEYCESLTGVTIGNSVMTIGNSAFRGCSSLTNVTIPDSVTMIGESAFVICSSLVEFNGKFASDDGRCLMIYGTLNSFAPAGLTEYTIPDTVATIGDDAFNDCDTLTSVTIPGSVTKIGDYAFYNCSSLKSVYCTATTPPSLGNSSVFVNNGSGRKIYVPVESVDAYRSADGWSKYASAIVGYDF